MYFFTEGRRMKGSETSTPASLGSCQGRARGTQFQEFVEDEVEDEDEFEGREVARREIQWVWRTENCSRATNNFFAFFWGIKMLTIIFWGRKYLHLFSNVQKVHKCLHDRKLRHQHQQTTSHKSVCNSSQDIIC